MANDIQAINSGVPLNQRGVVTVSTPGTGYQTYDERALNRPEIGDIENKYDQRFDDPTYYG